MYGIQKLGVSRHNMNFYISTGSRELEMGAKGWGKGIEHFFIHTATKLSSSGTGHQNLEVLAYSLGEVLRLEPPTRSSKTDLKLWLVITFIWLIYIWQWILNGCGYFRKLSKHRKLIINVKQFWWWKGWTISRWPRVMGMWGCSQCICPNYFPHQTPLSPQGTHVSREAGCNLWASLTRKQCHQILSDSELTAFIGHILCTSSI